MSNILRANVSVVGLRPILWHYFGPDAIPLVKGEKTGVAGNDPEEWRRTSLISPDGQLYVLPPYVFGTLCNGARYTKKGKGSIMTAVAATLQVVSDRILIDRYFPGFPNGHAFDIKTAEPPPANAYDLPTYLDVRMVKNPVTKSRNLRYRLAACEGWRTDFEVSFDKTVVSRSELEAVTRDAGKFVGLGNGRALGYGRFDVEHFEIMT